LKDLAIEKSCHALRYHFAIKLIKNFSGGASLQKTIRAGDRAAAVFLQRVD